MNTTIVRAAVASLFLSISVSTLAQPQYYDPQPTGRRSKLYDAEGETMTDSVFAQLMQNMLVKNGQSNAAKATFVFDQAFGGGMFDDLDDVLGDKLPWVGAAAARYDEKSWTDKDTKSDFPITTWYRGYLLGLTELGENTNTTIAYFNKAREEDIVGPNGLAFTHPQSLYRNGGENIRHYDSLSTTGGTHHIVAWAGGSDLYSHNYSTGDYAYSLKNQLEDAGENVSLSLFGDLSIFGDLDIPVLYMSVQELQSKLEEIGQLIGPNDSFTFIGSGFGSSDWQVINQPQFLDTINALFSRVSLDPQVLAGLVADGGRGTGPGIQLEIDGFAGPGLELYINGIKLDEAMSTRSLTNNPFYAFSPEFLRTLGPEFEIEIRNNTGNRVFLTDAYFTTGPVLGTAVPEVSTLATTLALFTGMAIAARLRVAENQKS